MDFNKMTQKTQEALHQAQSTALRYGHQEVDGEHLLLALLEFKSGYFEEALSELGGLLKREPKFHLAHLVQGDMLLAQTRVISDIGTNPPLIETSSQQQGLALLLQEAEARLNASLETLPQGRLPRALLSLDDEVQTDLPVDKRNPALYAYKPHPDGTPPPTPA